MPVIQINYDLKKQKDYPALFKAIEGLGPWCHPLASSWLVHTSADAIAVRNLLANAIDNDDALLVNAVSVRESAAWQNLKPEVSQWLKKYLSPAYA